MQTLLCATGNDAKFGIGKAIFARHGIELEQVVIDIDEIQSEDPERIIRDKARRSFEAVGKPVIVSDDNWDIPGLNGFPGPYMKSMNHWLEPEDFIRLISHLTNRTVVLHRYVAYQDEYETVIFSSDIRGSITESPRGQYGDAFLKVITLDGDNGKTVSEMYDAGAQHMEQRLARLAGAWQELAKWYKASKLEA